MSYERNTGMKVFSKLYVGYRNQVISQDGFDHRKHKPINPVFGTPLGFATPYEDNAAGRKRQATVDSWAAGWGKQGPDMEAKIIDNDLSEGFKITDDIKRTYYGGGNVVFRVEDPRGFELEIQAQNLMTIIRLVGLNQGGEIPGKCCWGRDAASNILIHESSEEYKSARLKAEEIKPLAGIKAEFRRGDIVILTNGQKAKYLGRFWFVGYEGINEPTGMSRDEESFDYLPKVCFTSKKFKLGTPARLPSGQMNGERIVAPKQFHVVQFLDGDKSIVTLYREIKAVVIDKPTKVEMTVEATLKYINSRTRLAPASASDQTIYLSAADHKRGMVWQKALLTEDELEAIKKRVARMNKDRFYGIYDYVNRHDHLGSPISFVIEHEGKLWHTNHQTIHDHYASQILQEDQSYTDLVRLDETCIYHNSMNTRSSYTYLRAFGDNISPIGEPQEVFVFENDLKNVLAPLDSWFKEGKLFTIKPVYEDA